MANFVIVPVEDRAKAPIRLNLDTIAYYEEVGPDSTSVVFVGDEIQRTIGIGITAFDTLIGEAITALLRGRRVALTTPLA